MKSYFVTGTDTGVGKTVITASLARILRKKGIDVGIMKPIATGVDGNSRFKSEDVAILHDSALTNDDENIINPIFLPKPVSPYDASKDLHIEIDIDVVFESYRRLLKLHQMVLVEGIGGIMTPIKRNFFVADLIKQMNLETIIVTRSALGTINHTVMTAEICKKYSIPVKGLVINNSYEKGGLADKNAPSTLHEVTGLPILGIIPFVNDCQKPEMIADIVEKNMDINSIIS